MPNLSGYLKRFKKSEFTLNVISLMRSTVFAQIITLAASPLLTRLYDPEQFGAFSLYVGITGILAIIVTGRYELSIMLPQKNEEANKLVLVTTLLSFSGSVLTFIIILFSARFIILFEEAERIGYWIYFIPLSVLFIGIYNALYYLQNRNKNFNTMGKIKVTQALITALISLGIGVLSFKANGLIIGVLTGQIIAVIILGISVFTRENSFKFLEFQFKSIKAAAIKYINFPKYLILAHSINSLSSYLPIVLLFQLYSPSISGFYSLADRTLLVPLLLVSRSFGEVLRQRAAEDYNNLGNCKNIYISTLRKLFLVSLLPFTVLFFASPSLFQFLFGENWSLSGEFAQLMVLMYFLQFMANPLGNLFMIAQKQKLDLLWQIMLLIASLLSIYVSFQIWNEPKMTILLYSISMSIMYIVNILMSYKFSLGERSKQMDRNR